MNAMNSLLLEGNLTRDPVLKTTPTGKSVVDLHIAHNKFYRKDEELVKSTSFFPVEAWGDLAETAAARYRKGYGIRIVGRLKQDRWDSSDGTMNQRVKIIAEFIELVRTPNRETEEQEQTEEATV